MDKGVVQMDKKGKFVLVQVAIAAMVISLLVAVFVLAAPSTAGDRQCRDGVDNDGDGHIDTNAVSGDSKCVDSRDRDESPRDFCNDTDFGAIIAVQGTASGEDNSVPFSNTDACAGPNTVQEFYCGGKGNDYNVFSSNMPCPVSNVTGTQQMCVSGACV